MQENFNKADKDGDNKLTRDEWKSKFGNDDLFDEYDLNHDGVVDEAEWLAGRKANEVFDAADKDGDNNLSREEWIARFGNDDFFDEYDLNHDGLIDAEEFLLAKAKENDFPGGIDRKMSREEWISMYGDDSSFDIYDLNHDGIIDPEEWMQMQSDLDTRAENMSQIGVSAEDLAAIQSKYRSSRPGAIPQAQWIARYGTEQGYESYISSGMCDPDEYRASLPRPIDWGAGLHQEKGRFRVPSWDGLPVQTMVPPRAIPTRARVHERGPDPLRLDNYDEAADCLEKQIISRGREAFTRTPTGQYRSMAAKRYCGVGGGWRIAAAAEGGDGLFGTPVAGGYSMSAVAPAYVHRQSAVDTGSRGSPAQWIIQEASPVDRALGEQREREGHRASIERDEKTKWDLYTRGMRQPNAVRYKNDSTWERTFK